MGKLLVVVDYQKDFVDGSAGFEEAKSLEDGICNKVKEYLDSGNNVICTLDTHGEDYLNTREGKNFPIIHCIKGSEGHSLYGKLKEMSKNNNKIFLLEKKGFGISPKSLCEIQKDFKDVNEIEIVGIVTNMCVLSNVVMFQNAYVNSDIVVNSKLCASFDKEMHEKTLDVLKGIHIKIINR